MYFVSCKHLYPTEISCLLVLLHDTVLLTKILAFISTFKLVQIKWWSFEFCRWEVR